jgi:phosphomannomutase
MIGIMEIDTFRAFEPDITVHTIFDDYDHTCPNHEANPIKTEALAALSAEVLCVKADMGIAFDGDADRVGFVDELGNPVASDLIGALLARYVLKQVPRAVVVCDVRVSWCVVEEIERLGGKVVREKVGHTHMRTRMRQENAALGIELSGHFFFAESYFSEGGPLPAFMLLELMKQEQKPLSQLVAEVKKYYQSGEINSQITRSKEQIYAQLIENYQTLKVERQDGLSLYADNWWCNVRPSANDPVLRLNVEAKSQLILSNEVEIILKIIRSN